MGESASTDVTSSQWINAAELPSLDGHGRIALFGAGQGSVDLLAYLEQHAADVTVVGILDNNPTLHGLELSGRPILDPANLPALDVSLVLITTISGRDAVGEQLGRMGLAEGVGYVKVGAFPCNALINLRTLLARCRRFGQSLEGARALHVGPGGNLGLECCLYALGASPVGVDAYSFGSAYPDVTAQQGHYDCVRKGLPLVLGEQGMPEPDIAAVQDRMASLFREEAGRVLVDDAAVDFRHPYRFSALPGEDASFDMVCSFAVLEHVRQPERAVSEVYRLLKPGGLAIQQIISQDHRSFGAVGDFTPLSHLHHSPDDWAAIAANTFHQNQVMLSEWRQLFAGQGFVELEYLPLATYAPPQEERALFAPEFAAVAAAEDVVVNALLTVRKP